MSTIFFNVKRLCILLSLVVGVLLLPLQGQATGTNNDDFGNLGAKLCEVVRAITGNIGRAIATLAIVFLGVTAFFGKANWGIAVAFGVGIFAIFGAAQVVARFNDAGSGDCV